MGSLDWIGSVRWEIGGCCVWHDFSIRTLEIWTRRWYTLSFLSYLLDTHCFAYDCYVSVLLLSKFTFNVHDTKIYIYFGNRPRTHLIATPSCMPNVLPFDIQSTRLPTNHDKKANWICNLNFHVKYHRSRFHWFLATHIITAEFSVSKEYISGDIVNKIREMKRFGGNENFDFNVNFSDFNDTVRCKTM